MVSSPRRPQPKGFAFLVVIFVAAIFVGLAGSMGTLVTSGLRSTESRMSRSACRFAAYSGLQHCLFLVKNGSPFPTAEDPDPNDHNHLLLGEMPSNHAVSYVVEVADNRLGLQPTAPDGTIVPNGSLYCVATGVAEGKTSVVLHAMTGMLSDGNPSILNAAFAEKSLSISGTATSGSFDPATMTFNVNTLDPLAIALANSALNQQGDVGSNRYTTLAAGATVQGDFKKPATADAPLGTVTGIVETLADPIDVPVIAPPVNFTSPDPALNDPVSLTSATPTEPVVYESLSLTTGGAVTVGPGRYFFRDGVDIDGKINLDPSVTTSDPVIFFIGNDARFRSEARVNLPDNGQTSETRRLQIVMVDLSSDGSAQQFTMEGQSQLFGAVLGGKADGLLSDQASLYGGFSGRSLECLGATQMVYDESLSTNPLEINSNWGMNGVTEPKPQVVLKFYAPTQLRVTSIQAGTAAAVQPIGSNPGI